MAQQETLRKDSQKLMYEASKYHWFHQSNWFGEPCINVAQDILAMQEIIFKTRPKYIIEVGVAWAGMLLFYATLMEVLGGEKIIAIDIFIPDDLKERISQHEKLASRIEWINGSSTDPETVAKIEKIVGGCRENLVVLDSDHTHDHVLKELRMYEKFVGDGQYMVCCDTIVEALPEEYSADRSWGKGDNPMTALQEFLLETDEFICDRSLENKLLLTSHPAGYLRRGKSL